ncbi:LytTR family DNA-binding domain-containing protein [uncultured Winogradskyella sp.]|uniref:LytR/AlgR family response regulator transcription factor n=1 Tax=uncultured Winogradskyella sp. TaxID=395353 RepID=UPI0026133112|nr:LytTR family DNA-binding domain-containing protein [uncultured Winogradskyella sp.]
MQNIRAIIVDDEVNNNDLLIHFLKQYCPYVNIVGSAVTKTNAIQIINEQKPDLLFLDIILDQGTGFDVLENVDYSKTKVIFVTSFNEFAVKAFRYNAIDYIMKPIKIEELISAVAKAYKDIENNFYTQRKQIDLLSNTIEDYDNLNIIAVPSMDKIDFVNLDDIIYFKSEGRYTNFYIKGKKTLMATKNIGNYEKTLEQSHFFRIHNSYIINLMHVVNINKAAGNYCEMSNGDLLPIAKRRQEQLHRFLGLK